MTAIQFSFRAPPIYWTRNTAGAGHGQKTVLVIGQSRGGTSLVAAILDALGVYMGEPNELHNGGAYESFKFVHGGKDEKDAEIARCNSLYDIWGWKQPFGPDVLATLSPRVRNPHCIFIFRDVVATTKSYAWHTKQIPDAALVAVLLQQARLLEALQETKLPSLVVSSEHAHTRPTEVIDEIIMFLKLTVPYRSAFHAVESVSRGGGYKVTRR